MNLTLLLLMIMWQLDLLPGAYAWKPKYYFILLINVGVSILTLVTSRSLSNLLIPLIAHNLASPAGLVIVWFFIWGTYLGMIAKLTNGVLIHLGIFPRIWFWRNWKARYFYGDLMYTGSWFPNILISCTVGRPIADWLAISLHAIQGQEPGVQQGVRDLFLAIVMSILVLLIDTNVSRLLKRNDLLPQKRKKKLHLSQKNDCYSIVYNVIYQE